MSIINQAQCEGCGARADLLTDAYSMHSIERPDGWCQMSLVVYPSHYFGSQRLSDFCSYDCMDRHVLAVIRKKLADDGA